MASPLILLLYKAATINFLSKMLHKSQVNKNLLDNCFSMHPAPCCIGYLGHPTKISVMISEYNYS